MKYFSITLLALITFSYAGVKEYNLDTFEDKYISGWDYGSALDTLDSITIIRPKTRTIAVKHNNEVKAYFIRYYGGEALNCVSGSTISFYDESYSLGSLNLDAIYFNFIKDESQPSGLTMDLSPGSPEGSNVMHNYDTYFEADEWVELDVPCDLDEYPARTFFVGAILNNDPSWNTEDSHTRGIPIPELIVAGGDTTLTDIWEDERHDFQYSEFPFDSTEFHGSLEIQFLSIPIHGELLCDNGSLEVGDDCSVGLLSYQGELDYFGADIFEYIVIDVLGNNSDVGSLKLEVQPVNDKPNVEDIEYSAVEQGAQVTMDLSELIKGDVGFTLGPNNEQAIQDIGSIELLENNHSVFDVVPTIDGTTLNFSITRGVLTQSVTLNATFHDNGGIEHGGVDDDDFSLTFEIVNTDRTQIRIDSVYSDPRMITDQPLDTIYINTDEAVIYFNYRDDSDTSMVVENITGDTLVVISAQAEGDQFPGSAEVFIRYNDIAPTIAVLPINVSDTVAPFGVESYWVLENNEIRGSYIEEEASIKSLWTNHDALKLSKVTRMVNKSNAIEENSQMVSLDNEIVLVTGLNTICFEETDVYNNRGEECFMIYFETDRPELYSISPATDSIEIKGSMIEVAYSGVFNFDDVSGLDTFDVVESDPRVFDGEGAHSFFLSYRDAYGNEITEEKTVMVSVVEAGIIVEMDVPVQRVNENSWKDMNPDALKSRVFIYNTSNGAFDDKGGENTPLDENGIYTSVTNPVEYTSGGFVVNISMQLPTVNEFGDGELNWDHTLTISYFVYDMVGQFVSKFEKQIKVDRPEYVSENNVVLIKDQMMPQNGFMVDSEGRQLATGVYLIIGYVQSISIPNSNLYNNVSMRSAEQYINLKQGYIRE